MKVMLQFLAFYPVDLPDINETAPVFQQILREKINHALSQATDDWVMEYQQRIPFEWFADDEDE